MAGSSIQRNTRVRYCALHGLGDVAAATRRTTADWIVLSSSMTTSTRLLQKGLQPGQDIIDHIIRHVLYEPCRACGIVDGSRLVAHHNSLRFRACVHQRYCKSGKPRLTAALCDGTN